MAEVKIEPDEDFEKNNGSKELLPEPQLILLSPPPAFLPVSGIPTVPWDRWLHSFEQYLDSLGEANLVDSTKCALLKHCLGQEGKRVYTKLLPDKTTYKAASTALTTHFGQHREMALLENGTLTVAKTVLIGKQIEYASAQSVLLCIQNVPSNEVNSEQQVQPLAGQRRSERLKKRKHSSTPTPSQFTEHDEANDYHCGGEHNHNGDDESKCSEWDCDGGSDGTDRESYHDDPMDEDFTVDSDEMEDIHNCNSNDFDAASGIIQRSSTKGHFCPICINRHFRGASKLARHMRSHTKDKPFCCPVCDKLFSQNYHMRRHLRKQHGKEVYICSICRESVGSLKELQTHKQTHAPYRFACPHCDQNFSLKSVLLSHVKSHTNNQNSDGLDKKADCSNEKHCYSGLGCENRVTSDICSNWAESNAQAASDNGKENSNSESGNEMGTKDRDENQHLEDDVCNNDGEAGFNKTKAKGHFCPICIDRSFRGASKLARHMRFHTKDKPFCCPTCAKMFSQTYHLRRHLRVQHGAGAYVCSKCGECLGSLEELQTHRRKHSPNEYSCPDCDRTFQRKDAFSRHIESHSHDNREYSEWRQVFTSTSKGISTTNEKSKNTKCYECPYCLKTFTLLKTQQKHLAIHAKEKDGTCPRCDQTFGCLEELKNHMETHKMSYSCTTCAKKFKVEYALKKHEQGHREDRHYCSLCNKYFLKPAQYKKHLICHVRRESKCPHCQHIFLRTKSFKIHLRSHVDERPYQCSCCIESFTMKNELDKHCLKHKKIKKANPYSCTRCDYAFSTLSELKAHMDLHNGEVPVNCPDCGKMFLNKSKLERHMGVHTGQRRHLCSICGHGFTEAASLKVHMQGHTGEKPYKCSQCTKSFASPSGLRFHNRVHMAVPPRYPCSECGRSYGRITELKMHQRYHTGDRPYKCTCCKKCFTTNYKLKVHMRIHTGERPYACSQCGQTFTQTGDRNRHMNKYH